MGDNLTEGETVQPEDILGVLTGIYRDGRLIEQKDFRYRLYVTLWCKPWPLRFALLRLRRFCHRVLSKVKRILRRADGK